MGDVFDPVGVFGKLRTEVRQVNPRDVRLLELNARYMRNERYRQLVANIKADGCLTSTPFCWTIDEGEHAGALEVLSGNHRIRASIDAGLDVIYVMVALDPIPKDRRIAIQLSHNAIEGEDDPGVLKQLYDEIAEIDLRQYSGLDDKVLELLSQVEVGALGEANLDFTTISLVFLPAEVERAREAFTTMLRSVPADSRWLVAMREYDPMLDLIETTHTAYDVANVATAVMLLIALGERHLEDLRAGWFDEHTGLPRHKGSAPLETLFGTRAIPADAAAVVAQAIDRARDCGDVDPETPTWKVLEVMAAEYLAGR